MPEANAFSAIFLPTFFEFSMFSFAFSPNSVVEAEATCYTFQIIDNLNIHSPVASEN